MANQSDRPATKKKLQELVKDLRKKNDGLFDRLNEYIENPDDPSTGKHLDSGCDDLNNFIDKIIDQVKPKVTIAKVEVGGEKFTPKDIYEMGKLAKEALEKLSKEHKTSSSEGIQKDAGDASQKLAKFTKIVESRSKTEKCEPISNKLKSEIPNLEKDNHLIVESTNSYLSDPKDPSTSKEVEKNCESTCERIDEILDELIPEIILTPLEGIDEDFGEVMNEDLKITSEEIKEAIKKVKEYANQIPKETAKNVSNASQKVAKYTKQLLSKIENLKGKQGDLGKELSKSAKALENGNEELVKSGKNYLFDPENPTNSKDLDAACDNLLQILDDVWEEINPKIERTQVVGSSNISSQPKDIERVGVQLKNNANDIENSYLEISPKQLGKNVDQTSSLCDTFSLMLEDRSKKTSHPELKKVLNEASSFFGKMKDDLIKHAIEQINDANNIDKQKNVKSDCESIKKMVDSVLDEVIPKINFSDFGKNTDPNSSPDKIEDSIKEMISSLEKIKESQKVSPKSVVTSSNLASNEVTKTGDLIKAYAKLLNNPSLVRVCNDAFKELTDGLERLGSATKSYVLSPENENNVRDLDNNCENLKRIGKELIEELKPVLNDPEDEDFSHIEKVTIPMLKSAYSQAKKDLEESRNLQNKTPSQIAQATEKAGKSINKFKAYSKIRTEAMNGETEGILEAIEFMEKANKSYFSSTKDYFGKPNDKKVEETLKKSGNELDNLLDNVLSSIKPTAKFTPPDYNVLKQRNITLEEIENLGNKIKEKLISIDSYHNLDEDSLCDGTSDVSVQLATFAELVYLKGNEIGNPNLTEALKRNLSVLPKEITNRNQSLVDKTNKYVDSPEDENSGKLLKVSCKNIRISIESAIDLSREATPKKDFRDQVLQAAGDIERAAKEWDCDDEIVGVALSIAEEMRKLAEAARKMDRKEIILRARNIADLVKNQIISYAKPIQDNCIDKQLQKDVSTGVQALSNFSVQLKIMASVQAADLGMGAKSGKINTAENQLVACCRGISTSMKATLKSTQSAKIKSNTNNTNN
eukprot:TRINITY_DN1112_c0_g2_i4.p1 TRINITY_DN1112_c0_g2~~TRINITY_DN1112_c0_g2_i4.p1  ORF type:complete len:1042 (+),score=410.85 TRINITY_DN1112_c0_g2_i4:150-3275(+)